jgi:hypothetical protein
LTDQQILAVIKTAWFWYHTYDFIDINLNVPLVLSCFCVSPITVFYSEPTLTGLSSISLLSHD